MLPGEERAPPSDLIKMIYEDFHQGLKGQYDDFATGTITPYYSLLHKTT
jgi:hypothetical protein